MGSECEPWSQTSDDAERRKAGGSAKKLVRFLGAHALIGGERWAPRGRIGLGFRPLPCQFRSPTTKNLWLRCFSDSYNPKTRPKQAGFVDELLTSSRSGPRTAWISEFRVVGRTEFRTVQNVRRRVLTHCKASVLSHKFVCKSGRRWQEFHRRFWSKPRLGDGGWWFRYSGGWRPPVRGWSDEHPAGSAFRSGRRTSARPGSTKRRRSA